MAELRVPILTVILGEGNSGGAVAIAMGNRVLMLEHATYSTIAPEACAMVLWRDVAEAPEAAAQMQITARQLLRLGLIDRVVPEPSGGAQRDPAAATAYLHGALLEEFARLSSPGADWAHHRYERYRAFGRFETTGAPVERT